MVSTESVVAATGLHPLASPARSPAAATSNARLIDVGIAFLCIVPLLLTAHLPLTDLPNHLARQYVLRDLSGSAILQTYYSVHWALVPNLALELFVLAARQVMSIDLAVRAFCIVTLLLLFCGTRMVNRAFSDGTGRAYRIAPLLCYGGPFQYGFLSYCFGIGLGITLFGFYLNLRRRSPVVRAPFLVASGFALMLCHLGAYGLFALAVGMCELTGNVADLRTLSVAPAAAIRRVALPLACLVPIFLLFSVLSPTAHTAATNTLIYSNLHERLRAISAITMFTRPKLEVALLLLALLGCALALAGRLVRFHATGLAIVAVMTLVWLASPDVAIGTSFISYRLPWAIAFFFLAALVPGPARPRWAVLLSAGFGLLVVARLALIAALWLRWEPTLNALDQAMRQLPEGARLMVVEGQEASGTPYRDPDLGNVSTYAVARREAFDPGMFASIVGQILDFQPEYQRFRIEGNFSSGNPSTLHALDPAYQYLLVLRPGLASVDPGIPLTCFAHGTQFRLFKVVPPDQAQGLRSCGTAG